MKWLHLGLGNFHKAHQAWYAQKMAERGENWEITAFSMQRPDAAQELQRLGQQYQVQAVGVGSCESTTVKSITQCGFLQTDQELLRRLARDPQMTLVTLTVTEKGYRPEAPAIEAIATILKNRSTPLTIVSCDNLQSNGHKLERLVRAHMGSAFPSFPVSFPNSMVDRIVPASAAGAAIKTEAFSQWVIEDKFVAARPLLENVGVQFVDDVAPWEMMKLRLLNAAHSLLAYYGLNRGLEFVHQAVNHPACRQSLLELWEEVIPLLTLPVGVDPHDYTRRLLARFDNPELPHRLAQIAADGSVKLPQRILPSLALARERGLRHATLSSVLDEWARAMARSPAELFSDPWRPISDEARLKEKILAGVSPLAKS